MSAVNINLETNIHYGVVSMNLLKSWLWDEIQAYGTNLSYKPNATDKEDESYWENEEEPVYEFELPVAQEGDEDENMNPDKKVVKGILWYLGGAAILHITYSPYTCFAPLCSPCCPNAGDLDYVIKTEEWEGLSELNKVETYTIPMDWVETDK